MKQYFEWIPATPDNLPKDKDENGAVLIIIRWKEGSEQNFYYVDQRTVNQVKEKIKYRWEFDFEYLAPASPLPISGDESQLSEGGEEDLKIEKLKAERNDYLAVLRHGQGDKYPTLNQAFQEEIEEVLKKYNKL